jgi:hypothetical protein
MKWRDLNRSAAAQIDPFGVPELGAQYTALCLVHGSHCAKSKQEKERSKRVAGARITFFPDSLSSPAMKNANPGRARLKS